MTQSDSARGRVKYLTLSTCHLKYEKEELCMVLVLVLVCCRFEFSPQRLEFQCWILAAQLDSQHSPTSVTHLYVK